MIFFFNFLILQTKKMKNSGGFCFHFFLSLFFFFFLSLFGFECCCREGICHSLAVPR